MEATCVISPNKPRKDGYVKVCRRKESKVYEYAHRIAYTEEYGEIPENLTIDHLCKVKNCINPKHLEAVSLSENVSRKAIICPKHGGSTKAHCKECVREYNKMYRQRIANRKGK